MADVSFKFQVMTLAAPYTQDAQGVTPLGYWRLGESSGTTAVAYNGLGTDGTYVGSPTLGADNIWIDDGNRGVTFDGTNDTVTMGNVAAYRFTGAFSISAWIRYTTSAQGAIVSKFEGALGTQGWGLQVNAAKVQFFAFTAAGATVFNITTVASYNDGLWHHVVATWNGTTSANQVIIYVDGVSVRTGTAVAGTIGTGAQPFRFGASEATATSFFAGTIDEVSVYGSAVSSGFVATLYTHFTGWANTYNADMVSEEPIGLTRGMSDNVPTSRVVAPGKATWSLRNGPNNVGSVIGYYSPDHASFNAVTVYGRLVRFLATSASVDYVLWTGRIRSLSPDHGVNGSLLCRASAQDAMGDMAAFGIKEVAPQINQTETALIGTVISALEGPIPQTFLDTAKETYPYALDNIGADTGIVSSVLNDIVVSAWGMCWFDVYNVLRYRNRTTCAALPTTATLTDTDIDELVVFGSKDRVYNRVRVTTHPRRIDGAATTVLCSGAGAFIPAGATVDVWLPYSNPDGGRATLIGGTAFVTPLVATTHYLANAAADGSGANLTANISIVTSAFAADVKHEITNSGADAYMTLLNLLGKGIYDEGETTYESVAASGFYEQAIDIDMRYKASGALTAGGTIATALGGPFAANATALSEVSFWPQRSTTLMGYAMTMDIGDRVSVTESVTGLVTAQACIVGITHEITPGPILRTRWLLSPNITTNY